MTNVGPLQWKVSSEHAMCITVCDMPVHMHTTVNLTIVSYPNPRRREAIEHTRRKLGL